MAFGTNPVVSHEDAPTFLALSALEGGLVTPRSRWSLTEDFGGADDTDNLFPAHGAFDRQAFIDTRSSTATTTAFFLGRIPNKAFNTIVLEGHNLGTIATGGCDVQLRISDGEAFPTPTLVHDFGTITDNKRICVALNTTFSNAERVSLRVLPNTGSFTAQPQISELFLSIRNVLGRQPNHPWDEKSLQSKVSKTISPSGVITIYAQATLGRFANLNFKSGINADRDAFRSAFNGIEGYLPFYFIDRPNTNPSLTCYRMVWTNPKLFLELYAGPTARRTSIAMEESAPYLSAE